MDAPDYPVAFVWEEVQLIVERQNTMLATEATLMKAAIDTGIAAFGTNGRKANEQFRRLVNSLITTGSPENAKKRRPNRVNKGPQGNGR